MSMSKITPGSIYQRSPNATHQTVAGEAIIIDLNSGQYVSLNETGAWLWEHLDGQATVSQLAHDLAAACNIPDQAGMVQDDLAELRVIVHAYEEWGENFVGRLWGMFALAIWDESGELRRPATLKTPLPMLYCPRSAPSGRPAEPRCQWGRPCLRLPTSQLFDFPTSLCLTHHAHSTASGWPSC